MNGLDLNIIWFFLVGVLLTGYAMLDGFDLGIGCLHLFSKTDEERRLFINSIGPVWDGNEVWLVTGGGALFAAFPMVYATIFSGFYIAFILLLFALIFRACSIEFRSKLPMKTWRQGWDIGFSLGSFLAALLIGVALGNIIHGIPLTSDHEFAGSFLSLLNPYSLLVGIMTIALFMMHGSIYLVLKTSGKIQEKVKSWVWKTIIFFLVCYLITTTATVTILPHMTRLMMDYPVLFAIPMATILAILNIPRKVKKEKYGNAFLSSCGSIILLMILFGIGLFPNLVYSLPDSANSLTIYNSASSQKTLKIMLIIALIGMPLVIAYTASIYWIFREKVKLDSQSY
jgi:cytochrome d ubiquinol oxidase subunit II